MAISIDSVGPILAAFDQNIEPLIKITGSVAFLIGIFVIYKAVMQIAATAKAGGQHNGHGGYKGSFISMFIGVALLKLPTTMNTVNESVFMQAVSPLSYNVHSSQLSDKTNSMLYVILHFIQFVGIVAFIRGLMIMNKAANGGGHDVSYEKGVVFILSGILAANIVVTTNMLSKSFGMDLQLTN